MSVEIRSIAIFDRNYRRLAQKYPSLADDLSELVRSLRNEPAQGTAIGLGCFKIRLAIRSKGKGKSGGARVITYLTIKDNILYFLAMYDKSEQASISRNELLALRAMIP